MNIPWVEKYRPTSIEDIVLSHENKELLEHMIQRNKLVNLLFYGPPGTGKTTTITNFIRKYQQTYDQENKDLIIHMNASDERGIETIRSQIMQFVNTKNLFNKGIKWVILDEVDYMTINGQIALKNLIQSLTQTNNQIIFCLIGNYLSKIEQQLQNVCIHIRFNQLPHDHIINLLRNICSSENISMEQCFYTHLIDYYHSDVRSMINYLQINHSRMKHNNLINDKQFCSLYDYVINNDIDSITKYIKTQSYMLNIAVHTFIEKSSLYFIEHPNLLVSLDTFLHEIKYILHISHAKSMFMCEYYASSLKSSLKSSSL